MRTLGRRTRAASLGEGEGVGEGVTEAELEECEMRMLLRAGSGAASGRSVSTFGSHVTGREGVGGRQAGVEADKQGEACHDVFRGEKESIMARARQEDKGGGRKVEGGGRVVSFGGHGQGLARCRQGCRGASWGRSGWWMWIVVSAVADSGISES